MHRRRRLILLVLTVPAASAAAVPAANAQAPSACPGTFHVLHDDHIGALPVAGGQYELRATGLTCAQASSAFAAFLSDYNGVLPKPWRYNGENTFARGTDGTAFTFARQDAPPVPGPDSHGDLACPGSFRVLHNDRVGRLSIPRGRYRITVLGPNLSCVAAERRFARFLKHPDGKLRGWTVLPDSGEFVRRSTTDGFRIKALRAA
jgi:hypothetical protein